MKRLFTFVCTAALLGFSALYGCGGGTSATTPPPPAAVAPWFTVASSGAVIVDDNWSGGLTTGVSGFFDLSFSLVNTNIGYFVGNLGVVDQTTNQAASATVLSIPSSVDPTTSVQRSVVATDNTHVWVTGGDNRLNGPGGSTVFYSSDAGTTWMDQANTALTNPGRSITVTDRLNSIQCMTDNLTCTVVGGYGDNTALIWTTTNGGTTWTQVYSDAPTKNDDELNSVDFSSTGTDFAGLAVGNTGVILGALPVADWNSSSWVVIASGTTQNLYGVACFDATTCIIVGAGGTILRSTDGGVSWSAVTSGTTQDLAAIDLVSGTTKAWAGGANGTMLYSSNSGATWTAQTTDTNYPIQAIYMIDENTGFAACANTASNTGAILKTTTGGQ